MMLLSICIVVGLGSFFLARISSGLPPDSAWRIFPPNHQNEFEILLPGVPVMVPRLPSDLSAVDVGRLAVVQRWYSRYSTWVAWADLDREQSSLIHPEELLKAERERRAIELNGTVTATGRLNFHNWPGEEVHYDTPNGPAVERLVLVNSSRQSRIYAFGASGPNLDLDSPILKRIFPSFRVEPKDAPLIRRD